MDPNGIASRGGARKIVHCGEIAREVVLNVGEQAVIGIGPYRRKHLASDRNRSLCLSSRALELRKVEREC